MDPIFVLSYPEYASIVHIQKAINNKHFSYHIPLSRQQKGFDFLIHNNLKPNKIIRVQVKSSRTYVHQPKKIKKRLFPFHLWLNNFVHSSRYHRGITDWFIIFGIYPLKSLRNTTKIKSLEDWRPIILCFKENELLSIRDKESKFMDIYFNINQKGKVIEVTNDRGFKKSGLNLNKYLLKNKINKLNCVAHKTF